MNAADADAPPVTRCRSVESRARAGAVATRMALANDRWPAAAVPRCTPRHEGPIYGFVDLDGLKSCTPCVTNCAYGPRSRNCAAEARDRELGGDLLTSVEAGRAASLPRTSSDVEPLLRRPLPGRADGPVLAISPHLDDAVLSVGASLSALVEAGRAVVVCTVFAGAPPAPVSEGASGFHSHCGLGDDAVLVRRDEDRAAVGEIGGQAVHLGFLDAIYRRVGAQWLCHRPGAAFDPLLPDEPTMRSAVMAQLRGVLAAVQPSEVWTCAAIGGHVDHRLVRDAATAACDAEGCALALWEDVPYAIGREPACSAAPISRADVRPHHLERKLAAVARYRSQVTVLWGEQRACNEDLLAHARQRRAWGAPEALWLSDVVVPTGRQGVAPPRPEARR